MHSMTAIIEGLTPLATGFCFGEGPRWFEGLLWFSDMLGEAVHTSTLGGALTTLPLPDELFQQANPANIDAYHDAVARELARASD